MVMPNHIHGIIIIGKNQYNSGGLVRALGIDEDINARRDAMHRVSTWGNSIFCLPECMFLVLKQQVKFRIDGYV